MTALELLNAGLQTVLLGSAGWLLVRLFLKDARHRAWARVQSVWTPARSTPGIGGLAGEDPVAISNRRNERISPSASSTT